MTLAADDPRHGTTNGYSNLRCRCARCREAWRVSYKEWRHKSGYCMPRAEYLERVRANLVHGEGGYRRGCRCEDCTRGATDARWRRRAQGSVHTHNANGYRNGCRCAICTDAIRVHRAEQRAKAKAA